MSAKAAVLRSFVATSTALGAGVEGKQLLALLLECRRSVDAAVAELQPGTTVDAAARLSQSPLVPITARSSQSSPKLRAARVSPRQGAAARDYCPRCLLDSCGCTVAPSAAGKRALGTRAPALPTAVAAVASARRPQQPVRPSSSFLRHTLASRHPRGDPQRRPETAPRSPRTPRRQERRAAAAPVAAGRQRVRLQPATPPDSAKPALPRAARSLRSPRRGQLAADAGVVREQHARALFEMNAIATKVNALDRRVALQDARHGAVVDRLLHAAKT